MLNWLLTRKLQRIAERANPDRGFVTALEQRLKKEMGLKPRWSHVMRLAAGSLTSLALLCTGTGAYAYSSDNILPDSPLYPVRQTLEKAEDTLAVTPQRKAAVRLKHVQRRLKERLLLDVQRKPVTRLQMENFVANVEAAIEANGGLSEQERPKFDRMTAQVEQVYTDSLVKAREGLADEVEKKKIDRIIETQTNAIEERVEKLQAKRQEEYQKLMERRKQLKQQQRLRLQDLPKIDQRELRQLLPQRRIFKQPAELFETRTTSTLLRFIPTTTRLERATTSTRLFP